MSEPGWGDVPPQVKHEIKKGWINPLTWLSAALTLLDFSRGRDGLFEIEREQNALSHQEQQPRQGAAESTDKPTKK